MTDDRKRYCVGVTKIPHADRDVARDVIGASGEHLDFFDIIGADTPDNDHRHPVGSDCTYAVELTEAEAQRFRAASNCRYVVEETYGEPLAPNTIPRPSMRTWMGYTFPELTRWHGLDVPIAVVDTGTTSAMRSYMGHQLIARLVGNSSDPPAGEVYDGQVHGCQVASLAVPQYGQLVDAFVSDRNESFGASRTTAAMRWAVEQGAKILNCSFGWLPTTEYVSPMTDALNYLQSFDVAVFFAAGNDGTSGLRYPSTTYTSYSWVHAVMAYWSSKGTLASFSNYTTDPLVGGAPGAQVAVVNPNATEVSVNGTSVACPNVAQMCARIHTAGRFTARESAAALRATFRDTGQPIQGGGAYDLRRALTYLGAIAPQAESRRAVQGGAAACC